MISVMFNWTIKTKCHVIDSLKCNSSPLQFLHKEIFIFLFYWKVEPTEALIQKKFAISFACNFLSDPHESDMIHIKMKRIRVKMIWIHIKMKRIRVQMIRIRKKMIWNLRVL